MATWKASGGIEGQSSPQTSRHQRRPTQVEPQQPSTPISPGNNEDIQVWVGPKGDGINSGMGSGEDSSTDTSQWQQDLGLQRRWMDELESQIGKFVLLNATISNAIWVFRGVVTEVGSEFVTLEDRRLGSRAIIPIAILNFIDVPIQPAEFRPVDES